MSIEKKSLTANRTGARKLSARKNNSNQLRFLRPSYTLPAHRAEERLKLARRPECPLLRAFGRSGNEGANAARTTSCVPAWKSGHSWPRHVREKITPLRAGAKAPSEQNDSLHGHKWPLFHISECIHPCRSKDASDKGGTAEFPGWNTSHVESDSGVSRLIGSPAF